MARLNTYQIALCETALGERIIASRQVKKNTPSVAERPPIGVTVLQHTTLSARNDGIASDMAKKMFGV